MLLCRILAHFADLLTGADHSDDASNEHYDPFAEDFEFYLREPLQPEFRLQHGVGLLVLTTNKLRPGMYSYNTHNYSQARKSTHSWALRQQHELSSNVTVSTFPTTRLVCQSPAHQSGKLHTGTARTKGENQNNESHRSRYLSSYSPRHRKPRCPDHLGPANRQVPLCQQPAPGDQQFSI